MLRPRVLVVFVWTAALLIGFGSESGAQTVSNVSLTSDKSSPQVIGTSITWTAVPSGGVTPYQYKWWIYNGVAWTSPTGGTTSNAYVWTPTGPDPFLVAVWVKSAGNPNDTYEAGFSTPFTITVDASRTLLFDRFAGPNGTLLTSHSPDVNQSHGVWTVPNPVVPVLQGQQLVPGQPDTATYVNGALIDAGAANGVVGVDWTGATSDT